ncbi:MAG: hypothetical protein OQK12_16840 [Motiliproteus sp.]|nr:hypothetical protein [Motiliproteus sp.]MCW9051257.1 hypothetical protein [Motiliproteus sp.]
MNNSLAISAKTIPYNPALRERAGSISAAILWQQLEYWFSIADGSFYKFLQPCDHDAYKVGDSWQEDIGFSPDEFRTAFDKLGVRYRSKKAFKEAEEQFKRGDTECLYCSYHDKRSGLTYYIRNNDFADGVIGDLVCKQEKPDTVNQEPQSTVTKQSQSTVNQQSPVTETDNAELQKQATPIYIDGESRVTEMGISIPMLQEITTENTQEITPEDICASDDDATLDDDGPDWISAKNKKLTGNKLKTFQQFWDAFDYRKGRAKAIDAWLRIQWTKSPTENQAQLDQIIRMAQLEAMRRPVRASSGLTPIYPEGWISQRRWEDEPNGEMLPAVSKSDNRAAVTAAVMDINDTSW